MRFNLVFVLCICFLLLIGEKNSSAKEIFGEDYNPVVRVLSALEHLKSNSSGEALRLNPKTQRKAYKLVESLKKPEDFFELILISDVLERRGEPQSKEETLYFWVMLDALEILSKIPGGEAAMYLREVGQKTHVDGMWGLYYGCAVKNQKLLTLAKPIPYCGP